MAQWSFPKHAPASADVLFYTDIQRGAVEKNRILLGSRKGCIIFVSARGPHKMVSRAPLCPPLVQAKSTFVVLHVVNAKQDAVVTDMQQLYFLVYFDVRLHVKPWWGKKHTKFTNCAIAGRNERLYEPHKTNADATWTTWMKTMHKRLSRN